MALLFQIFPEAVPAPVERDFHLAPGQGVPLRDGGHGVHIPVPPQKDVPVFLAERSQKTVDDLRQGQLVQPFCGVVRGGEALLQLPCELEQRGAALLAAPLPAAVQGGMAGNPGQKRVQVLPGLMGRDGVPGGQIHVVFALLGGLGVLQQVFRQGPQGGTVLFGGAGQGGLVPGQV